MRLASEEQLLICTIVKALQAILTLLAIIVVHSPHPSDGHRRRSSGRRCRHRGCPGRRAQCRTGTLASRRWRIPCYRSPAGRCACRQGPHRTATSSSAGGGCAPRSPCTTRAPDQDLPDRFTCDFDQHGHHRTKYLPTIQYELVDASILELPCSTPLTPPPAPRLPGTAATPPWQDV